MTKLHAYLAGSSLKVVRCARVNIPTGILLYWLVTAFSKSRATYKLSQSTGGGTCFWCGGGGGVLLSRAASLTPESLKSRAA